MASSNETSIPIGWPRMPAELQSGTSATDVPRRHSSSVHASEDVTQYEDIMAKLMSALKGEGRVAIERRSVGPEASYERIYPRAFDASSNLGRLRSMIEVALRDARNAVESFNNADIPSIGTNLSLVATSIKYAYGISDDYDDLASLLLFLKRSVISCSPAEVSRPMLNILVGVLHELSDNPVIELDDAAMHAESLSDTGWNGENPDVSKLLASFASADEEDASAISVS